MTKLTPRLITIALTLLILPTLALSAQFSETYFKFKNPDRDMLNKISRLVSIDDVDRDEVFAYANDRELADFERLGIAYEVLPHPGTLIVPRMMSDAKDIKAAWDAYPTYEAYVAMMYQFETDHPGLCRIVDAGSTYEGRSILFAVISDNVATEEDEPEVLHTSSMHGDETTGMILCLRLIDSLLVAYGTDAYITRMVDSCEIWINPMANPDGSYNTGNSSIYGAQRYTAEGIDMNRNFPDPLDGDHPHGQPWAAETVVMMNIATANSWVISVNHHGGAELINYPWDTWERRHPDDAWFIEVCQNWANSAQAASPSGYMDSPYPSGITNGYDWYRVAGGRQDYMNYWRGCREITTELSHVKLLPADQLPAHWNYNKVAFLRYLENALYGIRGLVTDATTALPIPATIRVLDHDIDNTEVFTDPDVGDYHRMISPGTYDLEFLALGYYPDTVLGVTVTKSLSTRVDIALTPLSGDPVLSFSEHDVVATTAGASVDLNVTLVNDGGGNATGATGLLQTTDPYVTIIQNSSTYPTIPGLGGTAQSTTSYQFSVAAGCPNNHFVELELVTSADGGYALTIPLGVVVDPVVEDFETGGFSYLPWVLTGDDNWAMTLTDVSEGTFSVRSGTLADNQYSQMSIVLDVAHPGPISFDFRVSSEESYDYLRFMIDGSPVGSWSGATSWMQASYPVEAGSRTFTWIYEKDGGVFAGDDRAWLDHIMFPSLVPNLQVSGTSAPSWTVGQSYSHQVQATGYLGAVTWSDRDGDLATTGLTISTSGLLTGTPNAAGPVQFTARAEDLGGVPAEQLIDLQINPLPQISTSSLPDASQNDWYEQQLTATGGTPPLDWDDLNNDLIGTGLSLSSSGLLSGTPSISGTLQFTAEATDLAGAATASLVSLSVIGGCCEGIVGDANGLGGDTPTIGDISVLIDAKFITGTCDGIITCFTESDVNQTGGSDPTCDDITIGDISVLIDHLFISGVTLPDCL